MPSKGEKIQLYGDSGAAAADLVARAAAGTAAVTAVAAAVAAHIRPPHYTARPPSLRSSHHLTILPPVEPNFFVDGFFHPGWVGGHQEYIHRRPTCTCIPTAFMVPCTPFTVQCARFHGLRGRNRSQLSHIPLRHLQRCHAAGAFLRARWPSGVV